MSISDSDLRAGLEGPLEEVVARLTEASGGHPDVDELISYHQGELPAERSRRVQDHLVACRRCVEDLLELERFVRPSERAAGGDQAAVADTEIVERAYGEGFEATAMWRTLMRSRSAPASRRWPLALAASLLLALGGVGLWTLGPGRQLADLERQNQRLSRPQLNPGIVDLFVQGAERGAAEEPAAGAAGAEPRFLYLILHPSSAREPFAAESYDFEIQDEDDRVLWFGEGLLPNRSGNLELGLPPGFLPPGSYRILLRAADAADDSVEATYDLPVPAVVSVPP